MVETGTTSLSCLTADSTRHAKGSQPKAHRHTGKRKCDTVPAQPLISTQEQVGRRANTVGRKQNVGAQTKGGLEGMCGEKCETLLRARFLPQQQ